MDPRSLDAIAGWLVARPPPGSGEARVERVVIDSRSVRAGDLFVALRGERFDGHAFLHDARAAGAVGAVVERPVPGEGSWPQLVVPDAATALGRVAAGYRRSLPVRTVSVTGSNGKTSTKEMIAAVLGARYRVAKTAGNLNNHLGVPLTLLGFAATDDFGVVEMGMNHAGEIAPLAALAASVAAVVTNVGVAHIGHLGSTAAIAAEKAAAVEAIPEEGVVVLNADDPFTPFIAGRARARVITAGRSGGAVRVSGLRHSLGQTRFVVETLAGTAEVLLPVPGEHMAINAALALAVGLEFGVGLEAAAAALARLELPEGRLRVRALDGIWLVDDAYNANPDSVVAALQTVAQMDPGRRKVAVLGRMGELGEESLPGHRQVGRSAAAAGFACIVTVGEEAAEIGRAAAAAGLTSVHPAGSHDEAVQTLRELLRAGDLLLVKGSAASRMDRVIGGLEALQNGEEWRAP